MLRVALQERGATAWNRFGVEGQRHVTDANQPGRQTGINAADGAPRTIGRRGLLAGLGAGAALAAVSSPAAAFIRPPQAVRELAFEHLHTGERLFAPYMSRGRLDAHGLGQLDYILRDWRTGDVVRIDRRLYGLLDALRERLRTDAPFQIISGYRAPKTNAMLRASSGGVAKRSYHTRAMAIDIVVPSRSTEQVRDAALALRRGGVGYYPASGFVHVDVGPVRRW
jgi:uncharacterized protein YcbK (DUF882 family)